MFESGFRPAGIYALTLAVAAVTVRVPVRAALPVGTPGFRLTRSRAARSSS